MGEGYLRVQVKTAEGGQVEVPVNVALPPCSLEVKGSDLVVHMRPPNKRSPHMTRRHGGSSNDLALYADVCGLLGAAASLFYTARMAFLKQMSDGRKDRYIPLANWSADCSHGHVLYNKGVEKRGVDGRMGCSAMAAVDCAAVDSRARAVSSYCLSAQLRRDRHGGGMQLRRPILVQGTEIEHWVEEGERLVRKF